MSSGLFDFFKDFLPSIATEDLQEEEEEDDDDDLYGRALLSYNEENANVSDQGNVDYYDEVDVSSVGSKAGSKPWRTSFDSFGDWRKGQKEQISLYLHDRINYGQDFQTEESDNDTYTSVVSGTKGDRSGSGNHGNPDDVEWESQQQGFPDSTSKDGITATATTTGKQDRTRYPHVKRALNFVSRMEDIDMYTKEVSMDLCLVEKIWSLRSTRRCSSHPHPFETKTKFPTYHGRLPRVPFLYKEDDGPFAPVYKTVLSIEVVQLVHQPRQNGKFSNAPLVSCSTDTSSKPKNKKRRLRVFFYNQYAEAMDKWLTSVKYYTKKKRSRDESPGPNRDLVISFRHIPAVCILPYVWNPRNFLDAEESLHYCLCIGDSARLQIPVNLLPNGEYSTLRLDEAPDNSDSSMTSMLEVRLATWHVPVDNAGAGANEELILSKESLNCNKTNSQSVHASTVSASSLAVALENWKKAEKQQELAGNRSATTTRAPSGTTTAIENMGLDQSETTGDERDKRARTDITQPREIRSPRVLTNSMEYVNLSKLDEVLSNNIRIINVYAVVLCWKGPSMTSRGDWMISASLVDDSLSLPDTNAAEPVIHQISINIFCKKKEDLPRLYRMGDVLRMRRVELKRFRGNCHLTGVKDRSAFVICRLDDANEMKVLPVASESYTWTEEDKCRAHELWEWGRVRILSHPTIRAQSKNTLGQIFDLWSARQANPKTGGEDADLTVMVTAIIPLEKAPGTAFGVLRVWDGTGVSESDPLPIHSEVAVSSIRTGDPPMEAVAKIAAVVETHNEAAANLRELQVPVSLCGRVVNAFIWEMENWELVNSALRTGNFIRLRNVTHGQKSDPRINIHAHSWITPVPDMCYEIRTMLEEHDQRSRRNDSFNPSAALLPIVDGAPRGPVQRRVAPTSAPQDLGSFACSPALGKFTGTVHMQLACPELASDPGRLCKPKGDRTGFAYRFGVKLWEDPPCPIVCVFMGDSAAEKLLGMSAAETLTSGPGGLCDPLLDPTILWKVTLRSVEHEGVKYMILSEVSRLE